MSPFFFSLRFFQGLYFILLWSRQSALLKGGIEISSHLLFPICLLIPNGEYQHCTHSSFKVGRLSRLCFSQALGIFSGHSAQKQTSWQWPSMAVWIRFLSFSLEHIHTTVTPVQLLRARVLTVCSAGIDRPKGSSVSRLTNSITCHKATCKSHNLPLFPINTSYLQSHRIFPFICLPFK